MSDTPSLVTVLSRMPAPREERCREHELTDLLAIVVCTLLAGGSPSHDLKTRGQGQKAQRCPQERLPPPPAQSRPAF